MSFFTIILLNLLKVVFLFPLHLFGLVCFKVVPSFAQYFSLFSFCLTFTVLGVSFPQAIGSQLLLLLVSALGGRGSFSGLCRLLVGRDLCLCPGGKRLNFSSR